MDTESCLPSSVNSTPLPAAPIDEYFKSYEDLGVHRLMLQDIVRTSRYKEVIYDAKESFQGKVIMDVGAGTGILSLICAKAGAKKVISVEASNLALILPSVVAKNGFSDIIQVVHSTVEDVTLEEQVDIIVSEWMGFHLLHESMLDSVIFARDKFLKPSGVLFPTTAHIYAAPCVLPELWTNQIGFWHTQQYDFDFSQFAEIAQKQTKPEVHSVPPDGLVSDPQLLWNIDLQTVSSSALDKFSDRRFFSIEAEEETQVHGVCVWFVCKFKALPGSRLEEDELELSTAPWDQETHWKQTVILFPNPMSVEPGDIVGWQFGMERDSQDTGNPRAYKINLEMLSDDEQHPVPCNCGTVKCEIIKTFLSNQKELTETCTGMRQQRRDLNWARIKTTFGKQRQ